MLSVTQCPRLEHCNRVVQHAGFFRNETIGPCALSPCNFFFFFNVCCKDLNRGCSSEGVQRRQRVGAWGCAGASRWGFPSCPASLGGSGLGLYILQAQGKGFTISLLPIWAGLEKIRVSWRRFSLYRVFFSFPCNNFSCPCFDKALKKSLPGHET